MLRDALTRLRACPPALEWVWCRTDPVKAWQDCPDGSWLAWVLVRTARTDTERREALGVVCDVVRELAPPRDPASERALSLTEAWCRGEAVTQGALSDAAYAALDAAYVAFCAADAGNTTAEAYAARAAAHVARAAADTDAYVRAVAASAISYASAYAVAAYYSTGAAAEIGRAHV